MRPAHERHFPTEYLLMAEPARPGPAKAVQDTCKGSTVRVLQNNTLRVQVPNNHILAQNLYYNYYYQYPKYLIIGSLDP